MKFEDIRKTYYELSGKVSDVIRQLGLAGIALIWIFKKDVGESPGVPKLLVVAGIFIIVGLAFDLLHYSIGTNIWLNFFHEKDAEAKEIQSREASVTPPLSVPFNPEEKDWDVPDDINWWPQVFFWTKFGAILVGYFMIITFLMNHLRYI